MLKAMFFVDGSWFDSQVNKMCFKAGVTRMFVEEVQFQPIWRCITDHLRDALGFDVDLVRSFCVAGHPEPSTVGPKSQEYARRITAGWGALKRIPCMSLELYPYDYGRREFPAGRDQVDKNPRKEKCVDVALATKMLYFAAVPGAYDVAVLVSGDGDYVPVLRAVRDLGKRTMLASFFGLESCAKSLTSEVAQGDLWDVQPLDLGPVVQTQVRSRPSRRK